MAVAQIIPFPSRSPQLRLAMETAAEHIDWLRRVYPGIAPEAVALRIDRHANTWVEAIDAYAATWMNIHKISYPQAVDNSVDKTQPVDNVDKGTKP